MAAILFTDVVGYSLLPNLEQQELSQEINERCARFLIPEFRHQRLARESKGALMVAAMPTGDGMVICLGHTPRPGVSNGHVLLLLALYLSEWSRQRGIVLRIGLHSGDLSVIEDINGNSNFCGQAINQAQRIMDLGGGEGHILCSVDFYQSTLSSNKVKNEISKQVHEYGNSRGLISMKPKLSESNNTESEKTEEEIKSSQRMNDYLNRLKQFSNSVKYSIECTPVEGDYTVKHGYQLKICNIVLSAEIAMTSHDLGNEEKVVIAGCKVPPPFRIVHEILDPRRLEENLGDMLKNFMYRECKRIVVLGSINDRFANHLIAALHHGHFLGSVQIDVYYCSDDILREMRKLQDISTPQTKVDDIPDPISNRDMVDLKNECIKKLNSIQIKNKPDIKFYEYPFLPCAGLIAGYEKADSPDPFLFQVNRYVWGQKSLWSSVQILRKPTRGGDFDEYSKFRRYIEFTQHNSDPITPSHVTEKQTRDTATNKSRRASAAAPRKTDGSDVA
jgi:hypothetical protein